MTPPTPAHPPRTVLFLTAEADNSIPAETSRLACLLPLGWGSFVERVIESCVQAGINDIDLVVCDTPEQLRTKLGNGERWGASLHWHLVKEGTTPYGVLHGLVQHDEAQILIGHAHQWLDARVIRQLYAHNHIALQLEPQLCWTGWACLPIHSLHTLPAHADYPTLAQAMLARAQQHASTVATEHYACAETASQLLDLQTSQLQESMLQQAPASWIRQPWGLMSPQAHVHPQATLHGPVLVGPGCIISRGAEVGPDTVLSRDVMVAHGAVVRHTLVLPNTYISGDVSLEHAIVQGAQVHHTNWGVLNTLAPQDALLSSLHTARKTHTRNSLPGRALAVALIILASPLFALVACMQVLRSRPWCWSTLQAIQGRPSDHAELQTTPVRVAPTDTGAAERWIGHFGALLDIAQARRQWFGIRPRTATQWYALRRDWQRLFATTPIGLLHAPAWDEADSADAQQDRSESHAVADAYFAVTGGVREKCRILWHLM